MDAKLVLDEKYYYLEVQHERIGKMVVGSSDHELSRIVNQPFKLSTKNCDVIKNGYDLDELAINHAEGNDNYITAENSFKVGVETILEILGDKKFSEEDLANILVRFLNDIKNMKYRGDEVSIINQLLQSLQPKEWDVEIVMESNLHIGEVIDESYPKDFPLERPKLDANGCIILKLK